MTRARCLTYWSSHGAALDQPRDCCESCRRSRALRRSGSPRTSSNPMPSPSVKSGFPRSMIRDCGQTIALKTRTNPCGDANENSSGLSRLDPPNGSCRSTPPSTTPFTSNAILCTAASSNSFEPRHSLSGIKVGLQSDPRHVQILTSTSVNVSMPLQPTIFLAPAVIALLRYANLPTNLADPAPVPLPLRVGDGYYARP